MKDTLSTLNDIANATSDSEHLDGLCTCGLQSSYAQEMSSWPERIGISNIVSGIEGVSAGQQPTTNNAAYSICGMKIGNIETAPKGIYSVNGMVSDGQGIVIHNRKKYINSKKIKVMRKASCIIISILAVFAIGFTACSCDDNNNDTPNGTEETVPGNNHKVLVAYFSEPLPDGVDASTSASRLVINDSVVGSVEYLAQLIRQNTGGDMVRIQTATPYPGNFDDLADQANQERQNDVHPALSTNIEDFDNYDVVFVGYPIW